MGKDFKRRFTVSLDIDTKDAEKQIKSTVGNLKTILADLGSASDKMAYFKELADYLSQVDTQLDSLRQKYGEGIFNQMFGGLDENLRKQMEATFGVAREQLLQLEQLKEKVATVKNSGTATGADLKPLEQEVRSLYESVGMLDKLDLSGKGKVETRIKKLEAALNGFAAVWDGLNNKVKNGFNFGNNGAENIISKLQSVKSMAESINNFEPIDIDCEVSIESATKLIEKFKELSAQRDLLINSGDMESEKYASVYAEQVKTAAQLIELREKLTSIGFESNQIKPINDFIDTEKNNVEGILEEFLEDVDELSSNFNNLTSTVGNGLNQIGEFADSAKSKIDFLNQSLQDILISASQLEVDTRNDKATGKETMNLFGGNGLISKVDGTDYQVDTDALVQQLLANLKQNIIMSLHNHANGLDVFSPSDVESFAKLYYGQGTKINGIIANGIVKTIDFSGVSQEVAIKIAQSYSENIKSFTSRYADYFSFDNGEFNLADKVKQLEITNPSQYAQIVSSAIDGINACLNDAFIKNGVEPTIQVFQKDELSQLAKYLSDIEQSGQNAIDPIEKLKNLIIALNPNQTFDWSQFSDIFDKFKSGAIDGTQALNQILNFKTVAADAKIATASIDQAEAKFKELKATAETAEEYINTENASLERKLELLSDIADQYANNITQRDRNRYEQLNYKDAESGLTSKEEDRYYELGEKIDEADEQLQQFGETYDKILLKLANGKTVEILPEDAGLRKFDKIANEFYQGEYDGIEIEDVIFMRKQEQSVIEQNNQELQKQLDIQEQIATVQGQTAEKATEAIQEVAQATMDPPTQSAIPVSAEKYETETQVIKQQNEELERNQQLKAQDDALDTNSTITGDTSQELNQLDELHTKLVAVKEAVDAKTQAFKEEYVAVDEAVDAEIQSLQILLEKLEAIVVQIGLINDGFNGNNPNIENLNSENITNGVSAANSPSQDYALELTLQNTNGILQNILDAINSGETFKSLTEPLASVVTELKNVANGIVEHQKAQRTDLTDSSARIANNYGQLSSVTENAVAGLGGKPQIESMKALADNIVRVRGAVQNADGVWKGFVVDIDESNKAVVRAIDEQSAFAKSLNETAQAAKETGDNAKIAADDSFTKSLNEQTNAFNKYRENLQNVSYISDDLRTKLDDLGTSLHQVTDTASLNAWKNSFSDVQKQITLAEKTFIAQQTGKVNQAQKALNDSFKKTGLKETDTNVTDEQQKIVDGYMQAKAALEAYKKSAQQGNQIEFSALQNVTNELYQQIEAYKQKNNIVDGSKKTYGDNAIVTAKGKYNSLSQDAKNKFADSTVVQDALNQYTAAYQKLIDKQKEYKAGQELNTDQKAEFKQLQIECNKCATELNKLITANKKFKESAQNVTKVNEDFVDTTEGRMKALQDFVQVQYGATAEIGKFDAACEKLTFTVDNGNGTFTQMTAAINPARNAIGAMVGETEKATTAFGRFFDELKGKFRTISTYLISSFSLQEVWQQLRQGVNYVREIDSALTELKKVTDETDATYEKFLQTASKTASIVGSTVSDFTNATADFARLGYNLEQASNLAEAASVYKNVGDGIDNISDASESIISTMKAFGIEAENAMGIVDRFNEIGNNFAISSTGIGEAMQRSASALYEAGNTIDESVALITAANSVVDFTPRRYSNITA